MADIVSIGKILRDIIIKASDARVVDIDAGRVISFPYKKKMNVDEVYFGAGGGAANSAISFAKLEKKASVLACIGNDPEGDEILNLLRMRFVDTDLIQKVNDKTGVSVILTSGNLSEKDHTILIYRGANKKITQIEVDMDKLNEASGWYISSVGSSDLNFLNNLIEKKSDNIKVAFNPGILQIKKGLDNLDIILQKTDILILNAKEAEELSSATGGKIFEVLKNAGPKLVIVTEGKSGAKVFDGTNMYYGKAFDVEAVEALGAGDAFGSTFFALWLDSQDIEKALKYALVNSAAALEKYGASEGLLSVEEIEKRLSEKPDFEIIKKSL